MTLTRAWTAFLAILVLAACTKKLAPTSGAPHDAQPGQPLAHMQEFVEGIGLRWGITPSDAKTTLSKRYKLAHEGSAQNQEDTWSQDWTGGTFADFPIDGLQATYRCDRLEKLKVDLLRGDPRPIMSRWGDAFIKTSVEYGQPAERKGPPPGASVPAAHQQQPLGLATPEPAPDPALEDVRAGKTELLAVWKLPQDRSIRFGADVGAPGDDGQKVVTLSWTFTEDAGTQLCTNAASRKHK